MIHAHICIRYLLIWSRYTQTPSYKIVTFNVKRCIKVFLIQVSLSQNMKPYILVGIYEDENMSGLVNVSHGLNEWRFACLGFVRIFVKSTIKYPRLLFFFFSWCVFSESSKHYKRCGKINIKNE